MKQSYYDPKYHNGTQPIRVLSLNILHWFENAEKGFLQNLIDEVTHNGLQKSINYIEGENPISKVAYVDCNKQIAIEETFLSYLWTISYSLVVLFDEVIMRPHVEKEYVRTQAYIDRIQEAQKLFDYGITLIKKFTRWDINSLPNPEYYDRDENPYIEKTNGIFLSAVNFVLIHEFAHVYLGHIDLDNLLLSQGKVASKDEIREDEYAADDYSFNTLVAGAGDIANNKTVSCGIISGLCALLFFDASLKGDDHPDPDERIRIALEKLNLDETNNLWGIASLAFRLWSLHFKIDLKWPKIVDTYRELFYLTLDTVPK